MNSEVFNSISRIFLIQSSHHVKSVWFTVSKKKRRGTSLEISVKFFFSKCICLFKQLLCIFDLKPYMDHGAGAAGMTNK